MPDFSATLTIPEKFRAVLIHGLASYAPDVAPLIKTFLADASIRQRYQFWFLYYPTGQPVPLSALQLTAVALDEAVLRHHANHAFDFDWTQYGGRSYPCPSLQAHPSGGTEDPPGRFSTSGIQHRSAQSGP